MAKCELCPDEHGMEVECFDGRELFIVILCGPCFVKRPQAEVFRYARQREADRTIQRIQTRLLGEQEVGHVTALHDPNLIYSAN